MKKIIIHIGANKTGTTAIQKYLSKNDDVLLSEHGILYPKSGRMWGAHFPLAWDLGLGKKPDHLVGKFENVWGLLRKEIEEKNAKKTIISSENFMLLSNSNIANKVKNYLEGYEVEIILYVRRQDLWLESLYLQRVKMGMFDKTFSEFVINPSQELDFTKILSLWELVTRRENIKVINFESVNDFGGAVNAFNKIIGLNIEIIEEYVNDSIDKHFAAYIMSRKGLFSSPKRLSKLLTLYNKIKMNYDDHSKSYFTLKERKKILEQYTISNSILFEKYRMDKPFNNFNKMIDSDPYPNNSIIHIINFELMKILFDEKWI